MNIAGVSDGKWTLSPKPIVRLISGRKITFLLRNSSQVSLYQSQALVYSCFQRSMHTPTNYEWLNMRRIEL